MLLDAILLIVCIVAFFRGWAKGLLWSIVSVAAVIAGLIISVKFSHVLADFLFEKNILKNQYTVLLSFIFLFICTLWLFRTLIHFAENALDTFFLGGVNRMLGALLYSYFVMFFFSMFLLLANKAGLVKAKSKLDSVSYEFIAPLAPKTIGFISPYIPYFKTLYGDVEFYLAKMAGGKEDKRGDNKVIKSAK